MEAKMTRPKCPKCNREMTDGYRIILGGKKPMQPYWFCVDWKNCKYEMLRK